MNSKSWMVILCLYLFSPFNAQSQFLIKINDFEAAESDLSLNGAADIQGDILRITNATPKVAGACWFARQKINMKKGFETEFTFRISGNDEVKGGGDGFAFVIQNSGLKAIGRAGDDLGYKGIEPAIAIEFDTYNNNEGSKNHIAVSYFENGKKSYRKFATVHEIPEINDGDAHYARIEYKNGFLTFFLDSYLFPVVSTKLDIPDILDLSDNLAWVGFTSSTSSAFGNHDLLKWTLKESLPMPSNVATKEIKITNKQTLEVGSRHVQIKVWDYDEFDGDVISLKAGDEWLLDNFLLSKYPKVIDFTVTGFNQKIILFANNVGKKPPNTAKLLIDDGINVQEVVLAADMDYSEAIILQVGAASN